MQLRQSSTAAAMALSLCILSGANALGQNGVSTQRLAAVRNQVDQSAKLLKQLPDSQRAHLSSALQNIVYLSDHFEQAVQALGEGPSAELSSKFQGTSGLIRSASPEEVAVSNPATDFLFSVMTGFTQSETSTAWCGNNVVVGFNDSGSLYETLLFGPGGASFSGVAYSLDGGSSFRDVGSVSPGPNPMNFLGGDPVVNCSSQNTFYFTQIFQTGTLSPFAPISSVAFSKSTNGGASWADPVAAVSLDGLSHNTDKPWSTVDPQNPHIIYVTYTDIDFTFSTCPDSVRVAIELVHSMNGGNTWSAPVTVDQACNVPPDFPMVQGSQVQVDSKGMVYVAWEAFGVSREMRIAKSVNHGASFRPSVRIDAITPTGDGSLLQGGIRNNEFPSLAIDRSGTATDGTVYVAWNDARYLSVPDQEGIRGLYGYADILLSRSRDGGKTWAAAVRVNSDPLVSPVGRGTDQFQPGIAVDKTGRVAACWYDRSMDPMNYQVGRTCGMSMNQGATWKYVRQGSTWPPIKSADVLVNPYYLGDYDQLSSDFLKLSPGFAGAFGNVTTAGALVPNQDVLLLRLP